MVTNADISAFKRASKALSNAKQRCRNKNNPDYASYGGAGIRVHIENAKALVAAIGLPPKGLSLDRIDPNGHYDIGNIRWATPSLQSANKKVSAVNNHLSLGAQINAARLAVGLRDRRKLPTVAWIRTLKAYNSGFMAEEEATWMAEHFTCPGMIEAGLDFNTAYDWTRPPPTFIHLPALSLPKARVRLRCAPALRFPATSQTVRMGRLSGLESLSPEWNIPKSVWTKLKTAAKAGAAGIAYHGVPTIEDLLGGWIEGSFLAAASCLAADGTSAACYPLLRVHKMLTDLPAVDWWDEEEHALLNVGALLIPDLSLDNGPWGDGSQMSWWKIGELLRWRYDRNLSTFVGIQNPVKLPAPVREIVLSAYQVLPMPASPPHELVTLPFDHQVFNVPAAGLTLSKIEADNQLRRLVVHSNQ